MFEISKVCAIRLQRLENFSLRQELPLEFKLGLHNTHIEAIY